MSLTYPVRVRGQLDPHLSRWLWLVKWVLVIPHAIVLAFLWIAFIVLSIVAFFAILITGRYPRAIFDFNVGVLRWNWRVAYYSYGALGTDRYPPFTLAEVPDYPATLDIAYPEHLSRGLVLVKSWLLAIPHYLVVAFFIGGGWLAWRSSQGDWWTVSGGGLVSLLAIVAAVILLFTSRYPTGIFDAILGMNRWVLRVAGYAGLMTDVYPPFRLDLGGEEPSGELRVGGGGSPPPAPPAGQSTAPWSAAAAPGSSTTAPPPGSATPAPPPPGQPPRSGWTGGRIVSVVLGSLLALMSLGLIGAGVFGIWADTTQRDDAGFLRTGEQSFSTSTAALVYEPIDIWSEGPRFLFPDRVIGDTRVTVTGAQAGVPLFVGIGPRSDVLSYLGGTAYERVDHIGVSDRRPDYIRHDGESSATPPAEQTFWAASASAPDEVSVEWKPADGTWALVAMQADGSPGVALTASVGATAPWLLELSIVVLVIGLVLLALGVVLVAVAASRASRGPAVRRDAAQPPPMLGE